MITQDLEQMQQQYLGTFIGPYTWILPTVQVRGFVPKEKRIFPVASYRMEDNEKVELK